MGWHLHPKCREARVRIANTFPFRTDIKSRPFKVQGAQLWHFLLKWEGQHLTQEQRRRVQDHFTRQEPEWEHFISFQQLREHPGKGQQENPFQGHIPEERNALWPKVWRVQK